MANLHIHRATDAFLYLPLYMAARWGLVDAIDPDIKVRIAPASKEASDVEPLMRVLANSGPSSSDIHIAVCDPMALGDPSVIQSLDQLVVLAPLIGPPPFWAVDKKLMKVNSEEAIGKLAVTKLIIYHKALRTGHSLGMGTMSVGNIDPDQVRTVSFGEELAALDQMHEKAPDEAGSVLAITADIVALAIRCRQKPNDEPIVYSYALDDRFRDSITTALVTSRASFERHRDKLVKYLASLRLAMRLLEGVPDLAVHFATHLAGNPDGGVQVNNRPGVELIDEDIDWIVNRIRKERWYPSTFRVNASAWQAVVQRNRQSQIITPETATRLIDSFETLVVQIDDREVDDLLRRVLGTDNALEFERMRSRLEEYEPPSRAGVLAQIRRPIPATQFLALTLSAGLTYVSTVPAQDMPTFALVGEAAFVVTALTGLLDLVLFHFDVIREGVNNRLSRGPILALMMLFAMIAMFVGTNWSSAWGAWASLSAVGGALLASLAINIWTRDAK